MDKIFEFLAKPAKLGFIIGGFIYALWFATRTAMSIDGEFMNVLTNIIILFVGTALCCLPPVFILIKKEELAKIFFVFLIGYWVLSTPTEWFFLAETFCTSDNAFIVITGILLFTCGLALIGLLVLVILGMILNVKIFKFIINIIGFAVVAAAILTGIFFMICCGIRNAGWTTYIEYGLVNLMILPVTVGFGCLYFFNPQKGE